MEQFFNEDVYNSVLLKLLKDETIYSSCINNILISNSLEEQYKYEKEQQQDFNSISDQELENQIANIVYITRIPKRPSLFYMFFNVSNERIDNVFNNYKSLYIEMCFPDFTQDTYSLIFKNLLKYHQFFENKTKYMDKKISEEEYYKVVKEKYKTLNSISKEELAKRINIVSLILNIKDSNNRFEKLRLLGQMFNVTVDYLEPVVKTLM
jgi:hypothetical protein